MKYMLLIYHDEPSWNAISEAERQQIYLEYRKLEEELQARGQYLSGSELQPISTATSVRVRDGKELITDGPFAETHEQLGGYFLVEAKDLDEATSIAARIPSARTGTVEVISAVQEAVFSHSSSAVKVTVVVLPNGNPHSGASVLTVGSPQSSETVKLPRSVWIPPQTLEPLATVMASGQMICGGVVSGSKSRSAQRKP